MPPDRRQPRAAAPPRPQQPDAAQPEARGGAVGERHQLRAAADAGAGGEHPGGAHRQGEEAERERRDTTAVGVRARIAAFFNLV